MTTDSQIARWLQHEAINAVKLGKKRIGSERVAVWTLSPKEWKDSTESRIAAAFGDMAPGASDFDEVA
jgi:hypothetical protein